MYCLSSRSPAYSVKRVGIIFRKSNYSVLSLYILTCKKNTTQPFPSHLCQSWALTITLLASLYALLKYGTSHSVCMIHEEHNTHFHFYEQQYIHFILQMQNWDAKGIKRGKKPHLLFLHIFRIIAFHTYEIVTGPWKWSPLVTSGKRLSTLMAFDLSSPNSAETCQTSAKLPGQHRGDTECQEYEGPASMGLGFTQEVLAHPQFGCQADWKSMSRRYPHGLHSAWSIWMRDLVFLKQADPPFMEKTGEAIVSLHSATRIICVNLSAHCYQLPT